ncbi:FAD-dependent oxidoreductase [Brevibacterium album]|uniref:FAD-dependent oxidoreductase n=1 Tax=Brevibacterium album TaxID=417948 RepID=UPI0012EB78FC|nr:FAD-dependent oxidoreductase [Brevibacterium album]
MSRTGSAAHESDPLAGIPDRVSVLVIGMGQAGLSTAYHLRRRGFADERALLLVDANPGPGGAWQHRWPSLTLETTNRVSDLPGWGLRDALPVDETVPAATTVPEYYGRYERRYGMRVRRPVTVERVEQPGGVGSDFLVTLSASGAAGDSGPGRQIRRVRARAVVNATGTWDRPRRPYAPGFETFRGRVLHTHDFTQAEDFRGQRVLVVGAGISAVQHIEELSAVTEVFWTSRRKPDIRAEQFTPEYGQAVIARVEERVRAGLPPGSVVSNTGLPLGTAGTAGLCTLTECMPMFDRVEARGVVWEGLDAASGGAPSGTSVDEAPASQISPRTAAPEATLRPRAPSSAEVSLPPATPAASEAPARERGLVPYGWGRVPASGRLSVDVLLWATGFLHRLDHLAPLGLRTPEGGIVIDGRLATRAAVNPGLHLPGYGPSASTIGANRAGRAVAREIEDYLAEHGSSDRLPADPCLADQHPPGN